MLLFFVVLFGSFWVVEFDWGNEDYIKVVELFFDYVIGIDVVSYLVRIFEMIFIIVVLCVVNIDLF